MSLLTPLVFRNRKPHPLPPLATPMQISFSPRVSVLNATLSLLRPIRLSLSFSCPLRLRLPRAVGYPFRLYRFLPLPNPYRYALFVLSMGQLRHRRNPSFAASPALFVVAAYSIYCSVFPRWCGVVTGGRWNRGGVISETNDGRTKKQRTPRTIC